MYGLWLFAILLAATIVRYWLVSRQTTVQEIVSTLAASVRQNLPLGPALQAAAMDRTDRFGRVARSIATDLEKGLSLAEAIRRDYPSCSAHVRTLIKAAESIGQLPAALSSLDADLAQQAAERDRFRPVNPGYPVFLVFSSLVFISSVTIRVLPAFRSILLDFGAQLPPITMSLFQHAAVAGALSVLALALTVLVIGPLWLRTHVRPRKPERTHLISDLGDLVKWGIPGWRWFERNHSMLRTVEWLWMALRAGTPLPEAIEQAAGLDVNACFRRRVERWGEAVERGEDPAEAAREVGLGRAIAWAFDNRLNRGDAVGVLGLLAQSGRTNYNYATQIARLLFWPTLNLVFALYAGYIVVALFLPLLKLISSVAG